MDICDMRPLPYAKTVLLAVEYVYSDGKYGGLTYPCFLLEIASPNRPSRAALGLCWYFSPAVRGQQELVLE